MCRRCLPVTVVPGGSGLRSCGTQGRWQVSEREEAPVAEVVGGRGDHQRSAVQGSGACALCPEEEVRRLSGLSWSCGVSA